MAEPPSDVHAFDRQLLRVQASAADRRGAGACHQQSADQYHAAGAPRQPPETARHDPGAGTDGPWRDGRVRPRLRHGPMVRSGQRRHAGGRRHGFDDVISGRFFVRIGFFAEPGQSTGQRHRLNTSSTPAQHQLNTTDYWRARWRYNNSTAGVSARVRARLARRWSKVAKAVARALRIR